MTASWPIALPQCPLLEFEETARGSVVSFEPESGPPIRRRRSSVWLTEFPVTFRMDGAQVAAFETFVRQTIVGGTLPFTMKHPRTHLIVVVRMIGEKPYVIRRNGPGRWDVIFTALVVE